MDPQIVYKEKSVIIHRDENGFGLRVGGQNPIFVDHVHENGAAWKAGVRKDDLIIKVNGTLVRSYDHQRVVHMIQNCTPFVNLTLHSAENKIPENLQQYSTVGHSMQSTEQQQFSSNTNNNIIMNNRYDTSCNLLNVSATSCNNNLSSNLMTNNDNPISKVNLRHQRTHPHTGSNNINWLLDIGDDLFQDNQHQKSQYATTSIATDSIPLFSIATSINPENNILPQQQQPQQQPVGVSKLIVSGPSPLIPSNSRTDSSGRGKPKLRHNTTMASIRDNPYYYYKTAPTTNRASELSTSLNSAAGTLISGGHNNPDGSSSKNSSSSLGLSKSRSNSKLSTRSTISGKYKARNFRSRLVEDLRSLSIVNGGQIAPSSLNTSPSSSDLSDCADSDSGSNINCPPSASSLLNTSTNSTGAGEGSNGNSSTINMTNTSGLPKSKHAIHRLEIIRELVDTEKTHTERLKHLNDLIYKPIKAEGLVPPDQLKMVFSCHKTLFKIHRQIYKILVAAQKGTTGMNQEPLVGKALVEIFEGELGKRLEKAASTFCACQSTNHELLNRFTRKDTKAGEFLAQVASQQMIGRLGIKDLLASCFQRLTKYPLLLENLLKATPNPGTYGIHSKSLSEGSISSMALQASIAPASSLTSTLGTEKSLTPAMTPTKLVPETIDEASSLVDEKSHQIDEELNKNLTAQHDNNHNDRNLNHDQELSQQQKQQPETLNQNAASHHQEKHGSSESIREPNLTTTISHSDTTIPIVIAPSSPTQPTTTTITITTNTPTIMTTTATTITTPNITTTTTTMDEDYEYERLCITRALHQSREILVHVNDAVTRAVAQSKLKDIWKKTDKHPTLPAIDVETQQLLHEGTLTLRLAKRVFEVYVILLTDYIVILTRDSQDKYKFKHFNADGQQFSPIFNIDEHLATRDTATDENGFYLLCKSKDDSRIYEFASQSPAERAKWKEKIHLAKQYNFTSVPDDDNTLTRYRELISLATSSNTPNNIEHSPA